MRTSGSIYHCFVHQIGQKVTKNIYLVFFHVFEEKKHFSPIKPRQYNDDILTQIISRVPHTFMKT